MVSVSYEGLSTLITTLMFMKMNIGNIQRVDAVKCGVFIGNYKANNLSLNSKLGPNLCSITESQPK
jgi:hypothetical protein